MLEMMYAIPEPVGWILVGYLAAWVSIFGWRVGKTLYLAIKDRLVDDYKEEDF